MPFRISDGVIVGTLSGLVGSVLTAIIETITMGLGSEQARFEMEQEIERAFDQAATQGSDPAVLEGVQQFMTTVLTNPFMLFLMVLVFTALVFTGFGALGGVIGGNIFKTKDLPTPADPMN
jgi:phosphotransferase system  glucose/maltose/N-acetylglucosamine-specific IIC component